MLLKRKKRLVTGKKKKKLRAKFWEIAPFRESIHHWIGEERLQRFQPFFDIVYFFLIWGLIFSISLLFIYFAIQVRQIEY